NEKVTDAFNRALSDIVADMAQDTQISQFIKQNARY
ncbi:MAG: YajG family lipoprotein, partial [Morganella sp. (in: enterobacteria)]